MSLSHLNDQTNNEPQETSMRLNQRVKMFKELSRLHVREEQETPRAVRAVILSGVSLAPFLFDAATAIHRKGEGE